MGNNRCGNWVTPLPLYGKKIPLFSCFCEGLRPLALIQRETFIHCLDTQKKGLAFTQPQPPPPPHCSTRGVFIFSSLRNREAGGFRGGALNFPKERSLPFQPAMMNVKYRRESDAPGLLQGRAETNSPGVSGSLPYLTLYFNWIYHSKRIQFKRIRLFTNIVIHFVTNRIAFLPSFHRVAFFGPTIDVGKSWSHDVGT